MSTSSKDRTIVSHSPRETRALGAALAAKLRNGAVLALHGELGSGKTCFVQGLARALGVSQSVNSPTYTIVNEYSGRRPLAHMDLYRISGPEELLGIDFESYLDTQGITVIEWAERCGNWLPADALHIYFEVGPQPELRTIRMAAGAPA